MTDSPTNPPRVRFAPSPTGFLHVGSARTFIFNWLYARHNNGTMILRVDDTDVERNTDASLTSIFEGLQWLNLNWDEQYKQSERLNLHRQMAETILKKGVAYRDFTRAHAGDSERSGATWLFNPGMRDLPKAESDRRAAAGEPFALRFRVPRESDREIRFTDAVYGDQSKSTADIEDFALLRSDGMPTYHLASCADDADLRITHVIRGQDHLSNTFKHILIFDAGGVKDQDVFEGVGEMVLAANDVSDAQVGVVGAGGEVISRHAVAAEEGEVFDVGGGLGLVAIHGVGEADFAGGLARDAEAEGERLSGSGAGVALGLREVAHSGVE
jgi:glutamyl/glutaminyl-tRNA synthetase